MKTKRRLKIKNIIIFSSMIIAIIVCAVFAVNRNNKNEEPIKVDAVTGSISVSKNTSPKVPQVSKHTEKTFSETKFSNTDDNNTDVSSTLVQSPVYSCFQSIGYTPTQNEITMLCVVVSSEAGYVDDIAQKAVAHTIINRVLSDKFPNSIYGVLTQENQYTAVHSYFDGDYRENLYPGSELWNHSMELCIEALNEWDFTYGAVAYYNPSISGYNEWFEQNLQLTYEDAYGRFFTTYN